MKKRGERITMVTAYDATFARLLAGAGVDVLLVGDSAGMVIAGGSNTLGVTMDEMVYHCRAVSRGLSHIDAGGTPARAHIVGDLPFLAYQASVEDAVRNAGRLVKEGHAEAVKLEGGEGYATTVSAIARIGIPVMGHIGLTPQFVHQMGGFRVQGRTPNAARKLVEDARALADAVVYALVLEGVPAELASRITASVSVPTIGIGAGPECDGQVLVIYDLLGLDSRFKPRFVKKYADLAATVTQAVEAYCDEVRTGKFPDEPHTFHEPELADLLAELGKTQRGPGDKGGHGDSPDDDVSAFWP